jgi:metallo-beta-lactamase class B
VVVARAFQARHQEGTMRARITMAACVAVTMAAVSVGAQQAVGTIEGHRAAARAAAGTEHTALLNTLCPAPRPTAAATPSSSPSASPPPAAREVPPRERWYAEPVKVFDNLYFVGQTEYSAWAVNTSDGIIVIDTIFDYSVEAEIVDGLKKVGLDPAKIRYAVVSHGHGDHSGGAKYLQDRFGTRIIMGAPDWDLVARSRRDPAPKKDMVATDGQKLTLGDTTVTLYLTPGHTPGTISTLVPVKDNGRAHLMAAWGGTAFNFPRTPENFRTYIESARRFRDIVGKAGADGLIANHTSFDGTKTKVPALAKRRPGDPHPYVIGTAAVQRYLTVAEECAKAALLELGQ